MLRLRSFAAPFALRFAALVSGVWFFASMIAAANAAEPIDAPKRQALFVERVRPLLEKHCFDCHGTESPQADLGLATYTTIEQVLSGGLKWRRVVAHLKDGSMPPPESPAPSDADRAWLIEFLSSTLNDIDCVRKPRPGRPTLRRLNRTEYRNTIRDLLGVDYEPAASFPADDVGYGFDNIGDVLSLPPLLMEKYVAAAEEIAQTAIAVRPKTLAYESRVYGANLTGNNGKSGATGGILVSNGEMSTTFELPETGKYELSIVAEADQAGKDPARMAIAVDGKEMDRFAIKLPKGKTKEFNLQRRFGKGQRKVAVVFLNDFYDASAPKGSQDRNLIVHSVELRGPLDAKPKTIPESHKRIFTARPDSTTSAKEATKLVMRRLISRAFRRPATKEEIERYSGLAATAQTEGDTYEESIQYALQAILCSPHFLFKVELDSAPNSKGVVPVDDFALATRLSYFLWSSMPDDELLQLARKGELRDRDTMIQQAKRMLADERASQLTRNFASQWLELRSLDVRTPDKETFPKYDAELKRSMRTETEMLFEAILREDRSVLDLLDANFTFVDERLAKLYDLPPVPPAGFHKVSLKGTERGGILTHASFLTITSNPSRTSPVKRGKWILQNLLNDPPPPAPPNVPELKEEHAGEKTETLRERLERHRRDPLCASCHKRMDPLGFALENFDGIGVFRTIDGKDPVDTAGELPTGEKISGPHELRSLLRNEKREAFVRCAAEKLLTYALGRGLEHYDRCAIDKIAAAMAKEDHKFSTLVREIVLSQPFVNRAPVDGQP